MKVVIILLYNNVTFVCIFIDCSRTVIYYNNNNSYILTG